MTFAEKLKEHTQYLNGLIDRARELTSQAKESEDISKNEQLISEAEELLELAGTASQKFETDYRNELIALAGYVDAGRKYEWHSREKSAKMSEMDEPTTQKLQQMTVETLQEDTNPHDELYLNAKEQENFRIAFTHCEDEGCGFLVEFKHPNSTFFFCKEHGTGINLDLNGVPVAGVSCELHGKMERYDLMKDDNVCPRCEKTTLAVLSMGRERSE